MNRKTILTITITLILGMAIGFFSAGQLARKRMKRERAFMENPRSEKSRILKSMELSDEQKPLIEPILEEYLGEIRVIRKGHKSEMDSLRKAMRNDIRPHLTEEQHNRLEKRRMRHEKRRKGKRR